MEFRYDPREPDSGTCSFAAWSNPALQEAIRRAFRESPRETITRIDVTRDGIRAYFEPTGRTST